MTDTLLVILDDVVAGTLTRMSGGRLRFDYDASYQERSGPTPLSLSMPVQVRENWEMTRASVNQPSSYRRCAARCSSTAWKPG